MVDSKSNANPLIGGSAPETAENVADVLKYLSLMDTAMAEIGEPSDDVANGKVLIFQCAIAALASIRNEPGTVENPPPGERGKFELVGGDHG